jgi:hypothetical protein
MTEPGYAAVFFIGPLGCKVDGRGGKGAVPTVCTTGGLQARTQPLQASSFAPPLTFKKK